jgi:hypothetical protein
MKVDSRITLLNFINQQEIKLKQELYTLHELILSIKPNIQLWYFNGKNETGKIVSNPNLGYGSCLLNKGSMNEREFYRIGLSPNLQGISIYVFGLDDKMYLNNQYKNTIGKAKISGYCIKFKSLKDLDLLVLKSLLEKELNKE